MKTFYRLIKDQSGVTLIFVALLLIVFLGIGALVVDLGVIYVARNELQNAADAGAMAGARDLYLADGSAINTDANGVALSAATANLSWGTEVEVIPAEVERGHWSFGLGNLERGFYPSNSETPIILSNFSEKELDENPDFINAVRVITRRQTILIPAFFSRIFEQIGFPGSAEAVAYLGYAGNLDEDEVDYPLAICRDSIMKETPEGVKVDCSFGKYLSNDSQTARWTNFVQPCDGSANANSVSSLMNPCGAGNPNPIYFGQGVTTMKGTQASSGFSGPNNLTDCWKASDSTPQLVNEKKFPNDPWTIRLLVVDCKDPDQNCKKAVGVVKVNVLWAMGTNEYAQNSVPFEMNGVPNFKDGKGWSSTNADTSQRWQEFVDYFNLIKPDGTNAEYDKFTVYFHQDCEYSEPTGGTGGFNSGILAKTPVLVR